MLRSYEVNILIVILPISKIAVSLDYHCFIFFIWTIDNVLHNPLNIEIESYLCLQILKQVGTECIKRHLISVMMVSKKNFARNTIK